MQSATEMIVPIIQAIGLICNSDLSEIPCRVSYDPHEWHNGFGHCLNEDSGEIPIAVKMPFTHS